MFSGATHLLPTIANYAQARKHWEETKQPRGAKWSDYQRPLKDARSHHYRMESNDPQGYFDLVLYRTVMARFYAPNAEGHEHRLYMGHGSLTSRKFLSDVLAAGLAVDTTDGRRVAAPIYGTHCVTNQGDAFSLSAWFTPDNKLIVEKSKHTRHWRKVSNADDKQARAELRKRWATYLTLVMFRMPEFIENVELNEYSAQPFRSAVNGWRHAQAIEHIDKALRMGNEPDQEQIDKFFEACQLAFNMLASKRGSEQRGFRMQSWHHQNALSTYNDLLKPPTPQDLIKTVERMLTNKLRANVRSGRQELPQFMPYADFPRSNVLARENP